MRTFEVSTSPLDPEQFKQELRTESAGACISFEGWVRNVNGGRPVGHLEYEGYEEMIREEGRRILDEAVQRFGVENIRGVHRLGALALGEMAVWVGVSSGHRGEGFACAAWVLEELKARLPIWKKEGYLDQVEEKWVGIQDVETPALSQRYARQLSLPGVGETGPSRLSSATVLVVGAGGLGCPALQYLAAAGVGTIRILDGDAVSLDNLHRQILFGERDLGMNKAQAARRRLQDLNPAVRVEAVGAFASGETLPDMLEGVEVVLDGSDNFATRFQVHDLCWQRQIPLIQGAVYQWEGQVNVFDPANGGGCLRCLWPEEPQGGCVGSCADTGIIGVTTGLVGVRMAAETLKLILGLEGAAGADTILLDGLEGGERRLRREPLEGCSCLVVPADMGPEDPFLHPASGQGDRIRQAVWIDLREEEERVEEMAMLNRFAHCPCSQGLPDLGSYPVTQEVLLVCASGGRARKTYETLVKQGTSHSLLAWLAPFSFLRSYI